MHLSYCTNVHPAEDLAGIIAQFDTYAVAVRRHLDAGVLGLGLWLAAPVAAELAVDATLRKKLRAELDARGLEVVTLNGFPYSAFQAPVVKHAVYHPDWTSADRLIYTENLVRILADLLPDGAERGSISTLPLTWRTHYDGDAVKRQLDALTKVLAGSERPIRVGFEPEPGCVVENTKQAVSLLSDVDTRWLGICLDLAHLAVSWEEPATAIGRLRDAGLPIVKVQMSAALEASDPAAAQEVLRAYVEPRFLHQTRSAAGVSVDDLEDALALRLPGPWRIHYHVPLHAEPMAPLTATVPVMRAAMRELLAGPEPACDHFDVETYTWSVLPEELRPRDEAGLAAGIAAELSFAASLLSESAEATR